MVGNDSKVEVVTGYLREFFSVVEDVTDGDDRRRLSRSFRAVLGTGFAGILVVDHAFFEDWSAGEIRAMLEQAAVAQAVAGTRGKQLFLGGSGQLSVL